MDTHQYDDKLNIVGACASDCLFRKEMLEEIESFDERYGSYYEVAELSWRACNRDWQARFVLGSIVLHHRGGTRREPPIEKEMKIVP
jgi:GT2 family glycosyltransferase